MNSIVSMGRGGTGKTSFIALLTKYFIELKETPLLLIDADPDQNLAEMVGVDLDKTISEALYEFLNEGGSLTGTSPLERIEPKILESLYEGESFDLLAIGTKWKEGCYCLPNDLLKKIFPTLAKNYKHSLIDSPAGLEHLNRRVTSEVDSIFEILNPSKKSFDHLVRAYKIIKELNIKFENLYLVGGYNFSNDLLKRVGETGLEYLGKIDYDKIVESYVLEGKSLLDLPHTSPAYISLKDIMKKIT
jgi:CO dehydrogenase maturation factor